MRYEAICPLCNEKMLSSIEFIFNRKLKRNICPCGYSSEEFETNKKSLDNIEQTNYTDKYEKEKE